MLEKIKTWYGENKAVANFGIVIILGIAIYKIATRNRK